MWFKKKNYAQEVEAVATRLAAQEDVQKQAAHKKILVDTSIADPEPNGGDERREYVAKVAELHTTIYKPKLLKMMNNSYELLGEPGNDQETDTMLKGAIYSFKELILWGDSMVNEDIAYKVGDAPSEEE